MFEKFWDLPKLSLCFKGIGYNIVDDRTVLAYLCNYVQVIE